MRLLVISAAAGVMVAGCASGSSRVNLNTDPALRETTPVLAKAATTRPYPTTNATGQTLAVRAEVDYQLNVINLINLGDQDLKDLVIWVNGTYSAPMSVLPTKQQRGVNFRLLFDSKGMRAPNNGTWVNKVELFYSGQLYTIRTRAAD
jgi:hypothetical protein